MLLRTLQVAFCVPALLAAASDATNVEKRTRNDGLFTNQAVRFIQIELAPENVGALKKDARSYVSCTFKEGGATCTNVAVRLKGVGSFRPIDQKPSLSFKFNKWVAKQEFYGLSRIALNNSIQDPSYVNRIGRRCVAVDSAGHWVGNPVKRTYVGGSTGTSYTRTCARDYAVSGFQARATDGLHRLRIECKHLDVSGQLTGTGQYLSWIGASTSGALQGPYRCASNHPGYALGGRSSGRIDAFNVRCRKAP